ncbi:MAG: peptidase domain-containing ABC transporter [Prolixibacteraceae bacterium]|jgi:ATP-binding cassette subfamily B protein|nr:peptidase domain-containing ABC transporter [Prolixibacteraceae bacterium]
MPRFPFYKQLDAMDCGPSCLRMIAKFYGKNISLQTIRERSFLTREGVSFLGLSDAAESLGMRSVGARIGFQQLSDEIPLPAVVHWKNEHFVVVYGVKKGKVLVADPAFGLISYKKEEFLKGWCGITDEKSAKGLVLIIEPTPDFYQLQDEKIDKSSFTFLFSYFRNQKKFLWQLLLGLILGSLFQLIFPLLTQSMVDVGINNQDIGFVTLILIAQLILFVSQMTVEFFRGWILLHLTTRLNISLISDFLIKLMKLPIAYFDTKMIGDLLQRIGDHTRIENFITNQTLTVLFSMVNLFVFSIVLALYSWTILLIFLLGSVLYVAWIVLFLKRRRELDFHRFRQLSENQAKLIELITGMQEIKLNNCEKQKRWEWERIQARLFKVNIRRLTLSQTQTIGSSFINQLKNILISFLAAKLVIDGHITLGAMVAVSYIIGQMNAPLTNLMEFIQNAQDAKISLERFNEIHLKKDEERKEENRLVHLPENRDISLKDVTFQYEGPRSPKVLKEITLDIPVNETTAIVGMSGSGKTTLIKLLLGFYPPVSGSVSIGGTNLDLFSTFMWREKCGVVMQDGYIFSDTIINNIAVGVDTINKERVMEAVRMANIGEYIESLPIGYHTKIGQEGAGLSQGQKQRILIARAVYKNPEFLFFDEATNALDANNEKVIMKNMNEFYKGRTVVVVAHRLSTVRNADQIVVLDKGEIVERGKHEELIKLKGSYWHLVKNQLELGA